MFEAENEVAEQEIEQTGVETPASPEPESPAPKAEGQEAQTKETPFHEHPRWKEVMEERNAERQARQALETRLADMQRQFQESLKPKAQEQQDPMYERLKGIDPEFAEYMKSLKGRAEKAEALESRLEQFERQQFTQSAQATFSELNSKNNVSPELSPIYEQQLEAAYARGEFKDIKGLREAYTKVHETYSKLFEAHERKAIEKYTTTKKQDASKPSAQPKGQAVGKSGKMEFSKDPAEAKQQLIKSIVNQSRAEKDI